MVYGLDSETHPIRRGLKAPPLVCMSLADDRAAWVRERANAMDTLRVLFQRERVVLHNSAFDLAVFCANFPELIPTIFKAVDEGRVHCTMVREMLADIGKGQFRFATELDEDGEVKNVKVGYGLDSVAQKHLGIELDKSNPWRMRFAELDGVPAEQYPPDAYNYARDDAAVMPALFMQQEAAYAQQGLLVNEIPQVQAAFALYLTSCRGMVTDPVRVAAFKAQLQTSIDQLRGGLIEEGFIDAKGKKNMARIKGRVEFAYKERGSPVPRTAPSTRAPDGNVKTDKLTMQQSGDKLLKQVYEYVHLQKLNGTYVPILEEATHTPITCNYGVLAETGRTTSYDPNVQNQPREPGVRECWMARPGWLLCSTDYKYQELCTLAQVCLWIVGHSKLAEALQRGMDPHILFAAQLGKMTYEQGLELHKAKDKLFKKLRQHAKVANFGFPGGMGAKKFVLYCLAQNVEMTEQRAAELRKAWMEMWPEVAGGYFSHISSLVGEARYGHMKHFVSGRLRGGVDYSTAANSYFQGLAADASKAALWAITKECFVDHGTALYGCRPWAFIHDEVILEVPAHKAHEAALRQQYLMEHTMHSRFTPDIPVSAEPALMKHWYKDAVAVYDANNRLIPWQPEAV